ncbi:autotransporter [Trinickia sp. YCB016]
MSDIHAVPNHGIVPTTQPDPQQPATQNTPPQPPAPQPTGPLVEQSALGRLANAMSRTGERLRTRKFDVSTAVSQSSLHGKPFAPADFKSGGERYEAKPVAISTAAATPLKKTENEARAALSKTARTSTEADKTATPTATQVTPHVPLDAMSGNQALADYVSHQFPDTPNTPPAADALSQRLAALGAQAGSPPTTRGALIGQALHAANVGNAHEATQVLDALEQLDLAHMDTARSNSPIDAHAWLVARTLARTDAGYDALEHLRNHGQPSNESASVLLSRQMMLQTADALDPAPVGQGARPDPSPGAVAARHEPPPNASLSQAPLAWQAYHAAATLTTHGRNALTPDQRGAFFAWRQNFREDGRGTELSLARERLNKFSAKTINRVGENRWKSFLPRLFGKERSPLSALRYGTQGVPRKTIGSEKAALEQAMRDALPPLLERPEMRPAAALSHARPEQSIAELAAMHVWLETGGFPNGKLEPEHLQAIAQRAQQLCDQTEARDVGSPATLQRMREQSARWAQTDPHTLAKSKPFKSIAKHSFDLERLASWGKVAKVPADSPFWTQVNALKQRARPDNAKVQADDVDTVRQSLKDVAHDLQSSSRLRLADGTRVGFSTRGLSANLSKVLHTGAVPIAPRLDLRASKTREAVVELSRGTHGVEMFVGTAKTNVLHAGAGVLVGYDFDVGLTKLRAGVTTQAVLHSRELSEPSGVSLRVARRVNQNGTGYDDTAMRTKLEGIIDHVFDESTQAHTGTSRDTWNRLADRYFDDPDVSISWTDTVARTVKRGVSADAGVSALVPTASSPVRAGVNIGIGYEKTAKQTLDSDDKSGRLRVEQHRVGAGSRLLGRLSGTASLTESIGSHDSSVGVGVTSLDAPSVTATFKDDSRLAKVTLIREGNTLAHRACLFDTEYTSAETYTHAVDASREQWIDLFSQQVLDEQRAERQQATLNNQPWPQQKDARLLAAERLDKHLGDVKANRRPNQTYFHRYRMKKSAAKQIDALSAMAAQLPAQGASAERAQIDGRIDRILNDAGSWMPVELKVKERTTTTHSPGINFALQLNAQTSATGDRELFAESVPFALAERLDQ